MTNTAINPSKISDLSDLIKEIPRSYRFKHTHNQCLTDEERKEAKLFGDATGNVIGCHVSYISTLGKVLGASDESGFIDNRDKENIGWLIHTLAEQYLTLHDLQEDIDYMLNQDDLLKVRGDQT